MTESKSSQNNVQVEVSQLDETIPVSDNTPHIDKDSSVLRPLDLKGTSNMKSANKLAIILMIVAVVAGIGTGFGINNVASKSVKSGSSSAPISTVPSNGIKEGDIFGSANESDFKDTATGYLEKGGIDGEGSHKLLREGGDSQTVYLTSSVTDLDEFEGMEIQIWGETFKAQTAGWLMDVGRVKVISTDGEKPVEE